MELFFEFGVLPLRSVGDSVLATRRYCVDNSEKGICSNVLDTARVKIGLIDVHDAERAGMVVVLLLFGNLLSGKIVG